MHAAKHMCMLQHACKASNMLYNVFKLAFHASMQSIRDAIYIYIYREREREREREIYTYTIERNREKEREREKERDIERDVLCVFSCDCCSYTFSS